mgnify:CR=1 FL=1
MQGNISLANGHNKFINGDAPQKRKEVLMAEAILTEKDMDAIINALANGCTFAEVSGMKKEEVEGLYSLAYNFYNSGNFKDADTMFRALCTYDYKDSRFWMGLAGCRQANGELKQAIDAYSMAGMADLLANPEPFFYAAKCYIKLGEKENAIDALKCVLGIGDADDPKNAATYQKAKSLLELLNKGE